MRLGQEFLDFFTALAAAEVFDAGVGVDSGRPDFQNRALDVFRRESAGENTETRSEPISRQELVYL